MPEDSITELTTTVLRKSKGRQLADGDRLLVNYQGTLLSGEQFDASFDFSSFELLPSPPLPVLEMMFVGNTISNKPFSAGGRSLNFFGLKISLISVSVSSDIVDL